MVSSSSHNSLPSVRDGPWEFGSSLTFAQMATRSRCDLPASVLPLMLTRTQYSLDFPDAPTGTIELILNFAIHAAGDQSVSSLSFGGAAAENITPAGDHCERAFLSFPVARSVGELWLRLTYRGRPYENTRSHLFYHHQDVRAHQLKLPRPGPALTLARSFRLQDRGSFRRKFGAVSDPQWVCFPKGGLGLKGVEALMKVLQSEK